MRSKYREAGPVRASPANTFLTTRNTLRIKTPRDEVRNPDKEGRPQRTTATHASP
jgi:hypothetical protein